MNARPIAPLSGFAFALALHAAALWGLWSVRIVPLPDEVVTLFVETLRPPTPPAEPPRPASKPQASPKAKPQPRPLATEAPPLSAAEPVAPPSPPAPVIEAPAAPTPRPAGPVTFGTELSVACSERTPPRYPPMSRRLGEEGKVVLRVELDEQGVVAAARVSSGSGHARLDEAALAAVKTWRCAPARRDGQPVRAVALQPFKFVLEGN